MAVRDRTVNVQLCHASVEILSAQMAVARRAAMPECEAFRTRHEVPRVKKGIPPRDSLDVDRSIPVTVLWGAYHLAKKSGNFGLNSNGKVIFRKFRSEIVEYLQRYSSFSVRNGTAEISLPFAKVSSF